MTDPSALSRLHALALLRGWYVRTSARPDGIEVEIGTDTDWLVRVAGADVDEAAGAVLALFVDEADGAEVAP